MTHIQNTANAAAMRAAANAPHDTTPPMHATEPYHAVLSQFGFWPVAPAPAGCPRYHRTATGYGTWHIGCDIRGWYTEFTPEGRRHCEGRVYPANVPPAGRAAFAQCMATIAYRMVGMG